MDLYGFGKTPHPDRALTIADYARGVRALVEEIGGGECVLIGHSFGGRVAMRLAAEWDNVIGVVLIDSAGILPRRGLSYHLKVFIYKIAKKLRCKRLPKGSADYAALSGAMKRTFVNVVNESSESDARRITAPTLLIWGSEDRDTPLFMCRKLRDLIPDSAEVILEDAGHFSYLESPDRVYRVVRAFAEGICSR